MISIKEDLRKAGKTTSDYLFWLEIPEFKGLYEACIDGRIRSIEREITRKNGQKVVIVQRIMKPSKDRYGYSKYCLHKNGRQLHRTGHRLVALTFIDNPENKPCVNHKNGNKTDNRKDNLEWCTIKENNQHARDTGLFNPSMETLMRRTRKQMRPVIQFSKDGHVIGQYISTNQAGRLSDASQAGVVAACQGKIKTSANTYWMYRDIFLKLIILFLKYTS